MKFLLLTVFTVALAADLSPTDYARTLLYDVETELWPKVTDQTWRESAMGGDIELAKAFTTFDEKIKQIQVPPRPSFETWLWLNVTGNLELVEGIYKDFSGFMKRQAVGGAVAAPVREWLDVSESVLLSKNSVVSATKKLDELMDYVFRIVHQDEHPDLCALQMSPHQLIFDMYNTISLTEIKGYAMMQFSWMLLRIYGKGNYTQEASLTRQRYEERTAKTAAAARAVLAMADRGLYRCDPSYHVEGETYAQVTKLLQGYIENEANMNPDATCWQNCAAYTQTNYNQCSKGDLCTQQSPCKGKVSNCRYLDSDMWMCPAPRNSYRRYDWIEYENGLKLGKVGSCMQGTRKVDSWWQWNLRHCSYCFCLCEDTTVTGEKFFSLREATSNVEYNKVVTGVRLNKTGRVFHLQVSEGALGPRGVITSEGWVPVTKFDPMDPEVYEGEDYHTLSTERRAIDLDELDSPSGYVLTGVRFRMLGPHLHFEIRSTPFNYTTGKLNPAKSEWISNDNTDGSNLPRSELKLDKPDVPTHSYTSLPVDSNHDQYIQFTHSDFEADAAQSTVPFVDIQPVQPLKGTALISGAGLIHRGAPHSGGFIAVKLITYDYTKHIAAEKAPSTILDKDVTSDYVAVVN